MTKKQNELIEKLKENHCNISDALECLEGITLSDFYEFLRDEDFKEAYDGAIQVRDDFADTAFMDLISEGDRAATIEYQKMKRQSVDANDSKQIRKELMRILVSMADTKGICLKEYCHVFKASNKMAEKQYSAVVTEFSLVTPYERMKERKEINANSLSTLLKEGNISEIEMYKRMLFQAAADSEESEYPSERKGARQDIISITQRLDEIQEKHRRDNESDDSALIPKCDALFFGTSVASCERVMHELNADNIKAIEDASDS